MSDLSRYFIPDQNRVESELHAAPFPLGPCTVLHPYTLAISLPTNWSSKIFANLDAPSKLSNCLGWPLSRGLVSVAGCAKPRSRSSAISYLIIQSELRLHRDTGQFLNLSKVVLMRCPTFLTKMQFPRKLEATRKFRHSHLAIFDRKLCIPKPHLSVLDSWRAS